MKKAALEKNLNELPRWKHTPEGMKFSFDKEGVYIKIEDLRDNLHTFPLVIEDGVRIVETKV